MFIKLRKIAKLLELSGGYLDISSIIGVAESLLHIRFKSLELGETKVPNCRRLE
jgi:hypothetical protein